MEKKKNEKKMPSDASYGKMSTISYPAPFFFVVRALLPVVSEELVPEDSPQRAGCVAFSVSGNIMTV